jgi:hypothetical protein
MYQAIPQDGWPVKQKSYKKKTKWKGGGQLQSVKFCLCSCKTSESNTKLSVDDIELKKKIITQEIYIFYK